MKMTGEWWALCAGVALMNAAMAVGSTAGTLVAADRLGAGWGALPPTAGIVGTGIGAAVLTGLMRRRDRRDVLLGGYMAGALGAAVAVVAVIGSNVAVLTCAMVLLGLGNASAQLSRYVAASRQSPERRGLAISVVVWSAAVGAVGGPLLLDTSGRLASWFGLTMLAGPFLLAAVACGFAAAALTTVPRMPTPSEEQADTVSLRALARTASARPALLTMVTAQVVMVLMMTAAPLDMHMHGAGLSSLGMVLSAHTLGMFALSPVTGRLCDTLGPRVVMRAGLVVVAVSGVLAAWTGPGFVALFLLGYGWNLSFVGGSSHLANEVPDAQRTQIEGAVDTAVWSFAAVAGLLSTILLSGAGYGALAGAATVLPLVAAGIGRLGAAGRTSVSRAGGA